MREAYPTYNMIYIGMHCMCVVTYLTTGGDDAEIGCLLLVVGPVVLENVRAHSGLGGAAACGFVCWCVGVSVCSCVSVFVVL